MNAEITKLQQKIDEHRQRESAIDNKINTMLSQHSAKSSHGRNFIPASSSNLAKMVGSGSRHGSILGRNSQKSMTFNSSNSICSKRLNTKAVQKVKEVNNFIKDLVEMDNMSIGAKIQQVQKSQIDIFSAKSIAGIKQRPKSSGVLHSSRKAPVNSNNLEKLVDDKIVNVRDMLGNSYKTID